MDLTRVIVGPVVTEKSERMKTANKRVYTLRVDNNATKIDVKTALKHFYDVEAASVRIMRTTGKVRRFGRSGVMQKRHPFKKVMVTLSAKSKALDLTSFK
ncbi:MAG: 50S ribosomal protein L23 [bacterium]|nr:50S ribosomal protein L23 [bacterium]